MKRIKTLMSITIALTLIIATPILANDKSSTNYGQTKKEEQRKDKEKFEKDQTWKETKKLLENEKDLLEVKKDELEEQKDKLEEQLEQAEIDKNEELIKELKSQIATLDTEKKEIKSEIKNKISLMKETVKNKYSTDELDKIRKQGEEFKKNYKNITVIPVENINIKNKEVKFDTPPVIKEGRTLIPVRAITEGLGATVTWDSSEKKVTINKGEIEIILYLDNKTATINGKTVELDVPSASYNNRTYVPLRFIIENLQLKVEYDEESGLIEIDDVDDIDDTDDTDGVDNDINTDKDDDDKDVPNETVSNNTGQ